MGATTRNLKDRLKEHETDIKKGLQNTAIARRAYEYDVKVEWGEAKVVKRVEDVKELPIMEGMRILEGSGRGEVINERQSVDLPLPWKYVIKYRTHRGMIN